MQSKLRPPRQRNAREAESTSRSSPGAPKKFSAPKRNSRPVHKGDAPKDMALTVLQNAIDKCKKRALEIESGPWSELEAATDAVYAAELQLAEEINTNAEEARVLRQQQEELNSTIIELQTKTNAKTMEVSHLNKVVTECLAAAEIAEDQATVTERAIEEFSQRLPAAGLALKELQKQILSCLTKAQGTEEAWNAESNIVGRVIAKCALLEGGQITWFCHIVQSSPPAMLN